MAASGNFDTVFYPGTSDFNSAVLLNVTAGSTNPAINFTVRQRSVIQVHSVVTYGFPGSVYTKPPYLSPNMQYMFLVATGNGLVTNNVPTTGLGVSVLGGAGLSIKSYSPSPDYYVEIDIDLRSFAFTTDTSRHLVFSYNNDIYVLPNAYFQVQNPPPMITGVSKNGDGSLTLTGTGFTSDSRVLFDGLNASIRQYDEAGGKLTVVPPPASVGQRAAVIVANADGQSSLFYQGDAVTQYSYEAADLSFAAAPQPFIFTTPTSLSAGTESLVQVDSNTAAFVDGQTVLGFGSADIQVKRMWVVSPTRLFANVAVSPNATPGVGLLSVTTGEQLISQPFAVQIQGSTRTASLSSSISGQPNLSAGATATATALTPSSLPSSGLTLYINDKQIPFGTVNGNVLTFQIPPGTAPGFATLRLDVNGDRGLPIGIQIDNPPGQVTSVVTNTNSAIDSSRPARAGGVLVATVTGIVDSGVGVNPTQINVNIGGVDVQVAQALNVGGSLMTYFLLPASVPAGSQSLIVTASGRSSAPYSLNIR